MIYKIFRIAEWEAVKAAEFFAGSPDDRRDGFLHFSAASQVRTTSNRHFSEDNNLVLVKIDPSGLDDLRWEVSRGGERFPHLYGPLPRAAIGEVTEIHRGPDGAFIFPPEIP